jgi:hypothetical protein
VSGDNNNNNNSSSSSSSSVSTAEALRVQGAVIDGGIAEGEQSSGPVGRSMNRVWQFRVRPGPLAD